MRLALVMLVLLCMGPAPGEVGGCGEANIAADAEDFCRHSGYWECERMRQRGDIDDAQECVDDVFVSCEEAQWPFTCGPNYPTHAEAQACIDELMFADNLDVELADIPECSLCSEEEAP